MPSDELRSAALELVWHETDRYRVRLARDAVEVRRAQVLRFHVFNEELREGLSESWSRGYDEDAFDGPCDHLIVEQVAGGDVIGTYRVQPTRAAVDPPGLYTANEFDLSGLAEILPGAIETGRACIHRDHRNTRVLQLLWQGLGSYMLAHRARYLFGCCSLTSQDPELGRRVMDHLTASGHTHPTIELAPQPDWRCYDESVAAAASEAEPVELPKLFSLYLRYGAKVLGRPALDRHFKTIDYLVLLDIDDLSPDSRELFFA